ncbi:neuralized-like protein 2 isoform X3 [Strix uralensis]|uniref:neuralized-like protein 2 isoform X3 n=1 Tax=Strix uralensis TaxID=36305 RepID=UPI003DA6F812
MRCRRGRGADKHRGHPRTARGREPAGPGVAGLCSARHQPPSWRGETTGSERDALGCSPQVWLSEAADEPRPTGCAGVWATANCTSAAGPHRARARGIPQGACHRSGNRAEPAHGHGNGSREGGLKGITGAVPAAPAWSGPREWDERKAQHGDVRPWRAAQQPPEKTKANQPRSLPADALPARHPEAHRPPPGHRWPGPAPAAEELLPTRVRHQGAAPATPRADSPTGGWDPCPRLPPRHDSVSSVVAGPPSAQVAAGQSEQ